MDIANRIRSKLSDWKKPKLSEDAKKEGAIQRQKIMQDAEVAKRLQINLDFIRFCELLEEDREILNKNLLSETDQEIKTSDQRTRLIARIFQINKILGKPKSLIWQMENLTEVRAAIQEQALVRQAHGNKTGGQDGN